MNTEQAVRRFSFIMDLGDFDHISSKQQIIASLTCGAQLTLNHIRSLHDRFGYFEILYDNKRIGTVPKEYTEQFFKDGVLQNNRCFVAGLVPQGSYTVTCEICVELFETELPAATAENMTEETYFPEVLPPKRINVKDRAKGPSPVYIGSESPVKKQFYKNELVIMLLCVLLPPIGIILLLLYSRRSTAQKTALISAGVCVCFSIFFACYMKAVNTPKPEISTSNSPERVAMQFMESWQAEQWDNLLYLSKPDTTADLSDIEEVFGAVKISEFRFTEIYSSENLKTYLLQIFTQNDEATSSDYSKRDEQNDAEYEEKQFTFDIERVGTTWYLDIRSLNHEFFDESLEELFAHDAHELIEEKPAVIVYIDKDTMTYHYRKRCAPDGAPENKLSEALRKGYGPCYKCAR